MKYCRNIRNIDREMPSLNASTLFPPRLKSSLASIWVTYSGRDDFSCVRNNLAPTAHTFLSSLIYATLCMMWEKMWYIFPHCSSLVGHFANNVYRRSGLIKSCSLFPPVKNRNTAYLWRIGMILHIIASLPKSSMSKFPVFTEKRCTFLND